MSMATEPKPAIEMRKVTKAFGRQVALRGVDLTVAEGEGQAIERVFAAIHNGDPTPDLIAIQYLTALQGIADGQATKLFLPLETSGILGSLGAIGEIFGSSDDPMGS